MCFAIVQTKIFTDHPVVYVSYVSVGPYYVPSASRPSLTNIRGLSVFFLLGRATVTNNPIRVPEMVIGPTCEIRLVPTLASRKNCDRGDIKVLPAPSRIFVERFPR